MRNIAISKALILMVFPLVNSPIGQADEYLEKEPVTMSLYVDNDLFTGNNKDEDYTGGFALTFSGEDASRHPFSIDKPLGWINNVARVHDLLGLNDADISQTLHSCEIGVAAFTPTEKTDKDPIADDRPYSSLIYLSNTQQSISADSKAALITSLSIGIMGLSIAGDIQNGIHSVIGSDRAEGWNNQISDGGEPTVKYSMAFQQYLDTSSENIQVTTSTGLSLGYLTEGTAGISLRTGIINTPRWSFNVPNSNYGEKSNITLPTSRSLNEVYFIAGANIKLRVYNAFLQGQFRDSSVSYSSSEIKNLVYEGWIGFGCEFSSGIRLNYLVRHQSSELKTGLADRDFTYGELVTSYKF